YVAPDDAPDHDCRGDAEFVNIVSLDQHESNYSFFTDPTFPETNLVFVRSRMDGTFAEVYLDCAGPIGTWMPIDAAGDVEFARIDLSTGNFASVGACANGVHRAWSTQPFGVTVWGWGNGSTTPYTSWNSYAY